MKKTVFSRHKNQSLTLWQYKTRTLWVLKMTIWQNLKFPPQEWAILFHCRRNLLSCMVTYSQPTDGNPTSFHPHPLPPCPPSLSCSCLWLCPPALLAHPGDMAACSPEKLQCHVHTQTTMLLPATWSVAFWPFLFNWYYLSMSNIHTEMTSRKYFIVFTVEGKIIYYKAIVS